MARQRATTAREQRARTAKGEKPYTDELAEWVRAKAPARQDAHWVAFLAIADDVVAALRAGYQRKTIWEHMRDTGRIQIRYETFLRYVRRHLGSGTAPASGPNSGHDASPQGFQFDPVPNKEDLV